MSIRKRHRWESARIATYARFSTDLQSPKSVEDQQRECDRFIKKQGGKPDPSLRFSDEAITGKTLNRPGLHALLDAAAGDLIDILVVEDQSRLSRSTLGNAQLIKELVADAGIRIVSTDGAIDQLPDASTMMLEVKASFAQEQLRETSRRTRRGLTGRHERGLSTGGRCYGYTTDEAGAITQDPDAAPVVVRIFEMFVAGDSYRTIAMKLNEDGLLNTAAKRGAGTWKSEAIREMLRNEKYLGTWIHNRREWYVRDDGTRTYRERPREEWSIQERPELAIVPAQLWEAAAAARSARGKNHGGRPGEGGERASKHLLSGLLLCAEGHTMIVCGGNHHAGGQHRYGCRQYRSDGSCEKRTVSAADVATLVLDELERLLTPSNLAEARAQLERKQGSLAGKLRAELGRAEKEQASCEHKGRRMAELATAEEPGPLLDHLLVQSREYMLKARGMAEKISELKAQLDRVADSARVASSELPSDRRVAQVLRQLRKAATEPAEGNVELRRVLRAFLPHGIRASFDEQGDLAVEAHWLPLHALVAMHKRLPRTPATKGNGRSETIMGCGGSQHTIVSPGFDAIFAGTSLVRRVGKPRAA
jgi:DNA invertase Pin-like site-specific DNA recombinase